MDSDTDPTATPPAVVKRKYHKRTMALNRQWNVGKALTLRLEKHLSYHDISNVMGISENTLRDALKPLEALMTDPALTQGAKANYTALLDAAQVKVLSSMMQPDKLERASLNNAAFALSKLHEMGRLESGQATQQVGVLVKVLSDAHASLPSKLVDIKLID